MDFMDHLPDFIRNRLAFLVGGLVAFAVFGGLVYIVEPGIDYINDHMTPPEVLVTTFVVIVAAIIAIAKLKRSKQDKSIQ